MWRRLLNYFVHLLAAAETTRRNEEEIRELRRELRDLALNAEIASLNHRHDMEKLALRLENELLKFERDISAVKRLK